MSVCFVSTALNVMPDTSSENPFNVLDTRDLTLPRRLWSWLAKQAKEQECSVDEVVAALIDEHRHPEMSDASASDTTETDVSSKRTPPPSSTEQPSAPPPSAKTNADTSSPDTYSAVDRLRRASDRLKNLVDEEDEAPSETQPDTAAQEQVGTRIRQLLQNNDKLKTLEPPEPTSKKSADEGVSMFDMASGTNDQASDE